MHGDGTDDIVSTVDMVCTECPSTHYCRGNGLAPVACPLNSASSSSASSTVIHDCVCNDGYLKTCTESGNAEEGRDCSDVTIFTCEEGQKPNFYQQGIRQSCPANEETTIPIATSDQDCVCIPGFEDLDSSPTEANCQACLSDEYTANYNELDCTACPDLSGHDSTKISDVGVCDCNMGYYGSIDSAFDPTSATPCTGCPAGTFKGSRGDGLEADLCQNCLEDKYSLPAASVCSNCRQNSQVESGEGINAEACKCNAGFDVADGDSDFLNPCVECEIGKFQSIPSNNDCQSCQFFSPPATQVTYHFVTGGQNCETHGYTTITDLQECSAANPDDSNGEAFELSTTSCYKRPLGCIQLTKNNNAFLHAAGSCSNYELYECGHTINTATYNCVCKETTNVITAEFYYQDSIGSIECNGCSVNAQSKSDYSGCECKVGHVGEHAENVNPTCSACAHGKFQEFVGREECLDCPDNAFHTIPGSYDRDDCVCNEGYYADVDTVGDGTDYCQSCEPGKYKDTPGMHAAGFTGCTVCPDFSDTNLNLLSGGSLIEDGSLDAESTCVCNAGYEADYHSTGPDFCNACPAGKFKDSPGTQACTDCEADHYQNLVGQLACKECPEDSSSSPGSNAETDCQCNPGFSGANGDPCNACTTGQKNVGNGCVTCGNTEYQPDEGATECLSCRPNSVSSADRSKCECNAGHTCPMTMPVQPGCQAMQLQRNSRDGVTTETEETMEDLTILNRAQTCGTNFDSPCIVTGSWGDGTHEDQSTGYCHHSACALTGVCRAVECSPKGENHGPCHWWNLADARTFSYYDQHHPNYNVETGFHCNEDGSTSRLDRYRDPDYLWLRWDLERVIYVSRIDLLPHSGTLTTYDGSTIYRGASKGSQNLQSDTYPNTDDYKYWGFANVRLSDSDTATGEPPIQEDAVHNFDLVPGQIQYNFPAIQARYIWFQYYANVDTGNVDEIIDQVIFDGIHVITPCAGIECPDGDCTACPADTYKETIDYAACIDCQTNAQSQLASDEETDCKCNRGYTQNDIFCEACSPGQYSMAYQFNSGTPEDDTDDLDAIQCASCGIYQYTSPHPAAASQDCEICTDSATNCESGDYWLSGCLIDPPETVDDTANNGEFVCKPCTAVLTSTDTASDANEYNRGPDACVCVRGAYYSTDPYVFPRVSDLNTNLAFSCGDLKNEACEATYTGTWNTHTNIGVATNVAYIITEAGSVQTHKDDGTAGIQVDLGETKKISAITLRIFDYNVNLGLHDTVNAQGACGTYFQFHSPGTAAANIKNVDGEDVSLSGVYSVAGEVAVPHHTNGDAFDGDLCKIGNANPNFRDKGVFTFSNTDGQVIVELYVSNLGIAEFTFHFPVIDAQFVTLISFHNGNPSFRQSKFEQMKIFGLQSREPGCDYCRAGTYKSLFQTYITARNPLSGYMPCNDCPNDKNTQSPGATGVDECLCAAGFEVNVDYDPVQYPDEPYCTPCPPGYYKNEILDDACKFCIPANHEGTWGPAIAGQIPIEGQSACTCDPGYDRQGGVCTACPAGKFKAFGGDYACEECAAGDYTPAPAVDAPGATACTPCQQNSDSDPGASICECIKGFQNSEDGSSYSSSGQICVECTLGTDFKHTRSLNQCELCDTVCGQNEYMQTECTTSSNRDCQSCSLNSNTPVDNTATNCFCNEGYKFTSAPDICTACSPGEFNAYNNDNTKPCESCESGKFAKDSASEECDDCFTSCASFSDYLQIEPQYISTECTDIAQIICSPCTVDNSGCTAGNYDDAQCGPEKRSASNCISCLTNSYCTGAYNQPVLCTPAGSVSIPPRESIAHCGCPPAQFSDGSNCVLCTGNVYCSSGVSKDCPLNSLQSGVDFTDIADCTCNSGYYRISDDETINEITRVNLVGEIWDGTPHPDDSFSCRECNTEANVDNSYCTGDNSRSICSDVNAETEAGSSNILDCKCKAGYSFNDYSSQCELCSKADNVYCPANQNEAEPCSGVGQNRQTLRDGADNVGDCVCIANFYLFEPDGLNSCQPCVANNYCPGGDVTDPGIIIPCPGNEGNPDRVESYASSSSISQCVCKAGFGCTAGTDCPGDTSDSASVCPSCIASAPTTRSGGTFKNLRGNDECADCRNCDATQYVNPNNANAHQCSTTSDRFCSPCTTCGAVETKQVGSIIIETGGQYQTSTCDANSDRSCSDCTTCENHWVDASFDDFSYENSACNNLFNDRQCLNYILDVNSAPLCNNGEYRGQHSWNQNSICDFCNLDVGPSYYANIPVDLHTWTGYGQTYDDETSCPFACKTNTVLLNPADSLQGCVSCETGNVLYKNIYTRLEGSNKVCDFECLYGSVKNTAGDDCIPISSIQQTSIFFSVEVNDQKKDNMLQFKLKFDDVSDYVITLQQGRSSCNPRGPKCCFASSKMIYNQASYLNLDSCGTPLDDAYENVEDLASSGAFKEIIFKIDEDKMKSDDTFFNCQTQTDSIYCSFTFSFVDVLLRRSQNQHIEMRIWRGSYDINVKENQYYTPLSLLIPQLSYVHLSDSSPQIYTYELKLDIALLPDSVTIDMPTGTTYEAEITLVRDISNQNHLSILNNIDSSSGKNVGMCDRHSTSSSSEWTKLISIDKTTKQWTTLWRTNHPHSKPSFIMFLLKINSIDPTTQQKSLLSYLKIVRSTSELKLLCQNVVTQITFDVASAYLAVGLDPEFIKLQLSSAYNENNAFNRHGYESRLMSLILTPSNTIPTTISELQVLAVHVTSDLKRNVELQTATTLQDNKLLFTKTFTSWCYENTCEFEYIRDINEVNCGTTGPSESWLRANIGTNTDLVISNGCSRMGTLHSSTSLFTIFKLRRGVFSKTFDENFSELETWTYIFTAAKFMDT